MVLERCERVEILELFFWSRGKWTEPDQPPDEKALSPGKQISQRHPETVIPTSHNGGYASQEYLMTEDEKEYALKAAETMALVMPYVERGVLVPGEVHADVRRLYAEPDGEALMLGPMRASDVAIKHLSKHFLHNSLTDAAGETVKVLERLKPTDLAGYGERAYDDGAKAVVLMANAMVANAPVVWSTEFESPKDLILAFNAVLLALLVGLAGRYRRPWEWAALQLTKEITTVTPRAA